MSVGHIGVFRRMVLMVVRSPVWYLFSLVELSRRKVIYLAEANYALPQRTTGCLCSKERVVPDGAIRQ